MSWFQCNGGSGRGEACEWCETLGDLVKAVSDVIVLNFLFVTEVAAVGDMVKAGVNGLSTDAGLADEVRWEAGKEEVALKGENVDSGVEMVSSS